MAALGKLRDLMLRKIELQFFKIVFEINYAVFKNARLQFPKVSDIFLIKIKSKAARYQPTITGSAEQ